MAQAAQPASAANGAAGASSSSNAAGGSSTASSKDIPRDARIIGLILASLGVTDAEPGVVAMLLEFAHRE
jgi:transcription initiation factor TFIID subunit 9B